MIKKILLGLLGVIVLVIVGFVLFINLTWRVDYSNEYPINAELNVVADSAMIARGKYLAYGPAHCAHCHAPFEKLADVERGIEVPMTGGFGLDIPPGQFWAPNITTDTETGIGRFTDGELYRMLRYNVRPNGLPAFGFMPFVNMSEEDLFAIIAYLRSTEPVKSEVLNPEYTIIGKTLLKAGVVKPGTPKEPVLETISKAPTAEYGDYMANAVANCKGCHTEIDIMTGQYTGEPFAGGFVFDDNMTAGWVFTTPNLTNHETGIMKDWSEDMFITRMKGGRVYESSPMPWASYASMDTVELTAIYRYLKSLNPVENIVESPAIPPSK